jgi:predicted PurR-regulated permease PerM
LGIIILSLSYIIPVIVTELTQFIKDLPSLYSNVVNKINLFIYDKFNVDYKISSNIGDLSFLSDIMENIFNYSIDTAQKAGSFLISTVVSVIISFFMVKDMDRTKNSLIVFASKNGKDSNRYKMFVEMDEILNSYVRGLLIDSIIVGIMTTILCLVLKLKYAVIFGIIITFLNLIPYIGAIVSYCITSLYALSVGGPVLAIITFIASFIIQMIDANILQPNIIAKSVKLHPVVVICGMLVFERLFGVVGMVIAMPVLALAKIYIKYKFNINFESEEETTKKVSKRKLGEKNKS